MYSHIKCMHILNMLISYIKIHLISKNIIDILISIAKYYFDTSHLIYFDMEYRILESDEHVGFDHAPRSILMAAPSPTGPLN